MSAKVPMTPDGFRKLQTDLNRLKTQERPRIVQDLSEAAARGDLSENSEYDDAKERLAMLNRKVQEIEDKLARAEVIDPSRMDSDKVVFGATVSLRDIESDEDITYQIVGVDEVDIKNGRISIASPIARALVGRRTDDVVKVQVPKGIREFEIVKIEFK